MCLGSCEGNRLGSVGTNSKQKDIYTETERNQHNYWRKLVSVVLTVHVRHQERRAGRGCCAKHFEALIRAWTLSWKWPMKNHLAEKTAPSGSFCCSFSSSSRYLYKLSPTVADFYVFWPSVWHLWCCSIKLWWIAKEILQNTNFPHMLRHVGWCFTSLWMAKYDQNSRMQESRWYAAAVCVARGLHCHCHLWKIASYATELLQYIASEQAPVKHSHQTSHFTCTLHIINSPAAIIFLKVSPMNIPAVLMQHRELQSRAVLTEHRSELTMAITTGLMPGWSRCAAVHRLTPQPRLNVVLQQHSPPSLPPSLSLCFQSHRWSLALQGEPPVFVGPAVLRWRSTPHWTVWRRSQSQHWFHTLFVFVNVNHWSPLKCHLVVWLSYSFLQLLQWNFINFEADWGSTVAIEDQSDWWKMKVLRVWVQNKTDLCYQDKSDSSKQLHGWRGVRSSASIPLDMSWHILMIQWWTLINNTSGIWVAYLLT